MSTENPGFRDLYNQPDHSDIRLCFNGEEIYAHKAILMGYSGLFKTAFRSKLPISTAHKYTIEGHPNEVVIAMIKHMYGFEYKSGFTDADRRAYKQSRDTTKAEQLLNSHINTFMIANEYQATGFSKAVSQSIVTLLESYELRGYDQKGPLLAKMLGRIIKLYMTSTLTDKSLLEATVKSVHNSIYSVKYEVINALEPLDPFSAQLLKLQLI